MAAYDGSIRIDTKIDGSGMDKGMKEIGASLSKIGGLIAVAFSVQKILQFGAEVSKLAISVESSMSRVSFIFGDATNQIQSFIDKQSFALGMGKADAYEYAAVYGNLFQGISKDAKQNSEITQNYLRMSAVIASKTGRTFNDVAERVRSGVLGNTEAIEDLGIYAQVAQLEMSDAFKKIADGRSWEKLTFQEQAQIRMLSFLEQANTKFGNKVSMTSAFAVSQLTAAWSNLKVTLGGIINTAIIPVINAFTALLQVLNAVMEAIFGKQIKLQTDSAKASYGAAKGQDALAKNTKKAGEAAKGALASFDELNVLQQETANTADKTAGAGDITAPKVGGINVTEQASALGKIDFGPFAGQIDDLRKSFKDLGDSVKKFWEESGIQPFLKYVAERTAESGLNLLNGTLKIFSGLIDIVTGSIKFLIGIFTRDWNKELDGANLTTQGLIKTIEGLSIALLGKNATENIKGFFSDVKAGYELGWALIVDWWNNTAIKQWWDNNVAVWFTVEKWELLFVDSLTGIINGWTSITDWWKISGLSAWWKSHVTVWFTKERWSTIWDEVKLAFKAGWLLVTIWWSKNGPSAWWAEDVAPWFTLKKWTDILKNVTTAFTNVFDGIGDAISRGIKSAINIAIDLLNGFIRTINKIKIDIPKITLPGGGVIGGGSVGFPTIGEIPKLANGAVIPPNAPFYAMLGDQKNGVNIETPLSTMIDAFKSALSEMGGSGGTVVLNLDGKKLAEGMLPRLNQAQSRRGANLVTGVI